MSEAKEKYYSDYICDDHSGCMARDYVIELEQQNKELMEVLNDIVSSYKIKYDKVDRILNKYKDK